MNYGLYLSTSGMLTSMYRMDVVASNLANAETPRVQNHRPDHAPARRGLR